MFALSVLKGVQWSRALVRSDTLLRGAFIPFDLHCTKIDTSSSPKFQAMEIGVLYKPSDGQYPFADLMMKINATTLRFYQATIGKSHPKSVFTFCKVKESLGILDGVKKVVNAKVQQVEIQTPASVKFEMHYLMRPDYADDVVKGNSTDGFFWDPVGKYATGNQEAEKEIDFFVLTWPSPFFA